MPVLDSVRSDRAESLVAAFFNQVYVWMGFGLLVTGGVSFTIARSEPLLDLLFGNGMVPFWILVIVQLGLVFFLSSRITSLSSTVASGLFVLYAALNGLLLAPVFLLYTEQSLASAFFISAGMFGAMSLYGYTTGRDLSAWGSLLFMGLLGLIIASIVNIWMRNETLMWGISYLGVLIFVGLTAYDTQKLKKIALDIPNEDARSSMAVLGALTLYLDFVNLFLYILRIMGKRRSN